MRGSLHVMLKYDNDYAYFHVKDTGVGIPQSGTVLPHLQWLHINTRYLDINKVFDRFHRVDVSRQKASSADL